MGFEVPRECDYLPENKIYLIAVYLWCSQFYQNWFDRFVYFL